MAADGKKHKYSARNNMKYSVWSIVALVLCSLGFTFPLGLVVAILDIALGNKKKLHGPSKLGIGVGCIWLLMTVQACYISKNFPADDAAKEEAYLSEEVSLTEDDADGYFAGNI